MRVVGQRTSKDTAKLIEEVARGDRLLEDIKDPELRETVRLALRLHKDPYSAPDSRTRSRIRARVLFGLRPHDATMIDRLAVVFELLGRPTPYAMRVLVVGLIVIAVAASTALVSAGTVADDALYSVKVTSEQMRLALATSPEDRAVVELSIAELGTKLLACSIPVIGGCPSRFISGVGNTAFTIRPRVTSIGVAWGTSGRSRSRNILKLRAGSDLLIGLPGIPLFFSDLHRFTSSSSNTGSRRRRRGGASAFRFGGQIWQWWELPR